MGKNPTLYYKQNRLKQLRAFCHAARLGSITAAAEALFLSQPSVSLQIQALERELDITLFERRGPNINLTPQGDMLYLLAQPLVEGVDKLDETFAAQFGKLEKGELNIAAGEATILYVLPEPIKQFALQYPGIRLKLHNVTGRDGLAMLRANEADFAVGPILQPEDDINFDPIITYSPMLITPLDHPLAGKRKIRLRDISPYRLILPPSHLSTWQIVDSAFRHHNLVYNVALEAGGLEVIKKYVELGIGISIVTNLCITGKESLATISLTEYFPERSYGIVQRQGKFLTPQARKFIEIMQAMHAA